MREVGTLAVVAALSFSTYALKAGGFWATGRIEITPRTEAALDALPGAVVVSLLVASLPQLGPPGWLAAAAVVGVAVRTDSTLLPLSVGVGAVVALRYLW